MIDWKCSRTEVIEWWVVYNLLKAFRLRPDDGNGASGAEEIKTVFPLFPSLSLSSLSCLCLALFFDRSNCLAFISSILFDEVEELCPPLCAQQKLHTERDHTSFRVMSFLFQMPRLRLGLPFRIKCLHKSSSHSVAVVYKKKKDLRFLFISIIRQKLTPTRAYYIKKK